MQRVTLGIALLALLAGSASANSYSMAWDFGLAAGGGTAGVQPPPELEPEWTGDSGPVVDPPLDGEPPVLNETHHCPNCEVCLGNGDCPGGYCVNGHCQLCDSTPCCPPCPAGSNCVNGQCELCVARDECCGNPDPCCGKNCNDGNPCTTDGCSGGSCHHEPINCDDGNPCTDDACAGGGCVHTPKNCDDGNPCTRDSCSGGNCTHVPIVCDDGDPCTNDECVNGACVFTPKDCDDGNPCTINYCRASDGACVTEPRCPPDDNPCTDDYCQNGVCHHDQKNCDDGNPCTTDGCEGGTCVHTWACDPPTDPCLERKCVNGQCEYMQKCDDGNSCTTDNCDNGTCSNVWSCQPPEDPCQERRCVGGVCQYVQKDCDDGNPCTTDNCVDGTCVHTWSCPPSEDLCQERKCVAGVCQYVQKDCDDGVPCTDDSCEAATGDCVHVNLCDDGNDCTEDLCVNGDCAYRWACDDGDPCTLDECVDGGCVHTAKNCDDGNPCTSDSCDPATGACVHTPKNCDDADPCTDDSCDSATGECLNTVKNCDDDDPCTTDSCDPDTGDCVHDAPDCESLQVEVALTLNVDEMRINADFDKNLDQGHREDFRDPDWFSLADDDLEPGTLTIIPALEGQFWFTFDGGQIGVWVCQGGANCAASAQAWQRVFSGGRVDLEHPGQGVYVAVEGLDGSAVTDDAQIEPHFCTQCGGCVFDGQPALLTVIKSEFMLTFDDGPYKHAHGGSMNTPANATGTILSALSDIWVNGGPVQAALFVVGHDGSWAALDDPVYMREGVDGEPDFNPSNHDLVQAATAGGHTLANHTNTHNAFFGLLDPGVVTAEINECNRKLSEAGQYDHGLFRPPYFAGYAVESVVRAGAAAAGKRIIWGSAYNDWQGISAQTIANNIVAHMTSQWNTCSEPRRKPYPNIVVLHDCAGNTAGGLHAIIEGVRQHGFVLVDFDASLAQPDRSVYQWFPE